MLNPRHKTLLHTLLLQTKRRRVPTCYLLSSKAILLGMTLLLLYFATMDTILLVQIKHRPALKPFRPSSHNHTTVVVPSSVINHTERRHGSFWRPLPVKKIMMTDATHYIRSPLAELVESALGFSRLFPRITANAVSALHCILSLVSVRYLAHDSLFWRQCGVALFQIRNWLDSFDGVIYRAHAAAQADINSQQQQQYRSHYGSLGYAVDAFADVFGGLCLVGACALFLVKRPPLKRSLTRCFRLVDQLDSVGAISTASSQDSFQHNDKFSGSNCGIIEPASSSSSSSSIYATKSTILASVALLGIRYGLSALFWDRSVHRYEDLLDSPAKSLLHEVRGTPFFVQIYFTFFRL